MYEEILSKLVIKKINSVHSLYSETGRVKKENRPNWAIIIKYEGKTVYTSQNKKYISNINNMVILPKGVNYEAQFVKSGHFYIIEFESDLEYNDILYFPIKNADKILELFKKTEYKMDLKAPMYELECIQNLYSIILKLAKDNTQSYIPGDKKQKLIPVIEYIAKNYTKTIKNDDLAAITGFSTDYFRKIFTKVYGVSPIEYINNLRIKKAKEMLLSDYISITNIAESLGYINIYDFSRAFKKHVGISPMKYNKTTLKNKG